MIIDFKYTKSFYKENKYKEAKAQILAAKKILDSKSGEGNDYLGWLDLPYNYDENKLNYIIDTASKIRKESDVLVVIGIGGSYLGAKSAIEALSDYYPNDKDLKIYFVGSNMSSSYLYEVYNKVKSYNRVSLNIISKSGSTTETSISTRIFLKLMLEKYGDKAYERIYATTDLNCGILHDLCIKKNIKMFEIPDNVGGRYSVLTAVGLLPIAAMGFDVRKILNGAKKAYDDMKNVNSMAVEWATKRYYFYKMHYDIEIISCFEPKLEGFIEWYKQLFAESEGKGHKGLFPTGAKFTTDLHSIGQMIQDGERNIIEMIIDVKKPTYEFKICEMEDNLDGLDFLCGKEISYVNGCALKATAIAHKDGGVPVSLLEIDELDEFNYGYLVYLFEYTCGLSAYALEVNPFNQPGVESYKKNMFALLGKPGYEELASKLKKED